MIFRSNAASSSSSWPDPPDTRGIIRGLWNSVRSFAERFFRELRTRASAYTSSGPTARTRSVQRKWTLNSIFSVHLGLILVWVLTLWWGEKMSFKWTVADCAWARWENRVCRMVIVKEDRMYILLTLGAASRSKPSSCCPHCRPTDR